MCTVNNLLTNMIEYNVDTRWNSTFQMIDDALKSSKQFTLFCNYNSTALPLFEKADWERLEKIHKVLIKFNEFSKHISQASPQISMSVYLYFECKSFLEDAIDQKGDFASLDDDISKAVQVGLRKYEKYYAYMDHGSNIHYIAMMLDPQLKFEMLKEEFEDEDAANVVKEQIRTYLHDRYSIPPLSDELVLPPLLNPKTMTSQPQLDPYKRMLERFGKKKTTVKVSDIDICLDSPPAAVGDAKSTDWLLKWWDSHKGEYPLMARVARDFLAIPITEVSCERLFNQNTDLLGLRRHSLSSETMRTLTILRTMWERDVSKGGVRG